MPIVSGNQPPVRPTTAPETTPRAVMPSPSLKTDGGVQSKLESSKAIVPLESGYPTSNYAVGEGSHPISNRSQVFEDAAGLRNYSSDVGVPTPSPRSKVFASTQRPLAPLAHQETTPPSETPEYEHAIPPSKRYVDARNPNPLTTDPLRVKVTELPSEQKQPKESMEPKPLEAVDPKGRSVIISFPLDAPLESQVADQKAKEMKELFFADAPLNDVQNRKLRFALDSVLKFASFLNTGNLNSAEEVLKKFNASPENRTRLEMQVQSESNVLNFQKLVDAVGKDVARYEGENQKAQGVLEADRSQSPDQGSSPGQQSVQQAMLRQYLEGEETIEEAEKMFSNGLKLDADRQQKMKNNLLLAERFYQYMSYESFDYAVTQVNMYEASKSNSARNEMLRQGNQRELNVGKLADALRDDAVRYSRESRPPAIPPRNLH